MLTTLLMPKRKSPATHEGKRGNVAFSMSKEVDYLHCRLFQLVKVHSVDFVQSLLVEFSRLPQSIKSALHTCRIVTIEHILQFIKATLALVNVKHLKQMNLRRVEYGCLHNPSIDWFWGQSSFSVNYESGIAERQIIV